MRKVRGLGFPQRDNPMPAIIGYDGTIFDKSRFGLLGLPRTAVPSGLLRCVDVRLTNKALPTLCCTDQQPGAVSPARPLFM